MDTELYLFEKYIAYSQLSKFIGFVKAVKQAVNKQFCYTSME